LDLSESNFRVSLLNMIPQPIGSIFGRVFNL